MLVRGRPTGMKNKIIIRRRTKTKPFFFSVCVFFSGIFFLGRCRLAYGLDNGIVIVDFIQKCVLLNISTADMYGSADPYQRAPRSPKRTTALSETSDGERCRSPSIDQVILFLLRFNFLMHKHTNKKKAHFWYEK